ncbi:MAG: aminoacyl-tRNA hydrolase [Chloroflexi bacterium]|jgi:PTH1 family peptidyl-tRNA hydrolase|nr:aminoacyl-tRNA hydrolase [Chloroflexota bacterium]
MFGRSRQDEGPRRNSPPAGEGIHLIVGLGNPGPRYAKTRHNIGFMCIDYLAQEYDISVKRKRFKALLGEGRIGAQRVVLAKPLTFMNDSGQAVSPISRWYKVPPERILIIHDDLDLPLGKIRLRPSGSAAGHHGMESIIAELGTSAFPRLRIGIGRPERGDPIDYVLGDFSRDQEATMRATLELVGRLIPMYLDEGITKAMNEFNSLTIEG